VALFESPFEQRLTLESSRAEGNDIAIKGLDLDRGEYTQEIRELERRLVERHRRLQDNREELDEKGDAEVAILN
jgi:hypothetical protein